MAQSIVEYLRQCAIEKLFAVNGFSEAFPAWKPTIDRLTPAKTPHQIYNLGDHLKSIFNTTNTNGRSQSSLSTGGSNWESLVCWYLNLCLIGRRTVVLKHNKEVLPAPISDAITVNYGTFPSNSESDLIAITFPNLSEYVTDKDTIQIRDINGQNVPLYRSRRSKYNLIPVLDALCARDFGSLEIHIIQCKTNWNDNAQVPMLWDIVYSASDFRTGVTIGRNNYSIVDANRFTYSFVTVPSNNTDGYSVSSTAVLRVKNLTGGNYWGLPSAPNVASSVKEMLTRNLRTGANTSIITSLQNSITELSTTYSYFRI